MLPLLLLFSFMQKAGVRHRTLEKSDVSQSRLNFSSCNHLQLLVRADVEVLKHLLCVRQISRLPVFLWMHF